MTTTIQTLAAEMSRFFTFANRPNGEEFRKLKHDAPGWMTTVCRKAHDDGRILPDDWRYAFIEQSVDALAECEDIDTGEAWSRVDADPYGLLTAWLHSLNSRVHYLNQALTEYGPFDDGFRLLAAAQWMEKEEVFQQVIDALEAERDSREEA